MTIIVPTTTEEIVQAKFIKTIAIVEGYYLEARGDIAVDQSYDSTAVFNRMERIKITLQEDLRKLASEIQIKNDI